MKRLIADLAADALLVELLTRYKTRLDLRRVLSAALRKLGKMKELASDKETPK